MINIYTHIDYDKRKVIIDLQSSCPAGKTWLRYQGEIFWSSDEWVTTKLLQGDVSKEAGCWSIPPKGSPKSSRIELEIHTGRITGGNSTVFIQGNHSETNQLHSICFHVVKMKMKVTAEHPACKNVGLLEIKYIHTPSAKYLQFNHFLSKMPSKTTEAPPDSATTSKVSWFTTKKQSAGFSNKTTFYLPSRLCLVAHLTLVLKENEIISIHSLLKL